MCGHMCAPWCAWRAQYITSALAEDTFAEPSHWLQVVKNLKDHSVHPLHIFTWKAQV